MTIQKVKDYPDLVKVNSSYIVNTNNTQYRAALARRNAGKKIQTLEEKIASLESSLSQVLDLLKEKNQ